MARSAADWMARRSGITTGRARAALEASRRLACLPGTDQALAKGELSSPQAEAITDAATADPSSKSRLLGTAKRRGLRELREDCARTKARAEDAAERANRLHRQRCLRTWKGSDGSWNLSLRNTPKPEPTSKPPSPRCGSRSSTPPAWPGGPSPPRPTPPTP